MKIDPPVRMLIVDESPNDAEAYASALRNAALPVRTHRAATLQEVEDGLATRGVEVILCTDGAPDASPEQILRMGHEREPQPAHLVVLRSPTPERVRELLRAGALDVVAKDELEHLQLVALREFRSLLCRRELNQLRQRLRENEERSRTLIDSSRDAIIYTHQGMYILANPAFLKLFEYADASEVEGLPILDMIVPEQQQRFKDFLRAQEGEAVAGASLEVRVRASSGATFEARMELWPATIDGEACTQIIIREQPAEKRTQGEAGPLASLLSPQRFLEALEQAMRDRSDERPGDAVLCLGLDHFENVRSAAGIAARDEILAEMVSLLKTWLGPQDFCGRFADDVFGLCALGRDREAVQELAESIRAGIADHVLETSGRFLTLTSSIGIGFFSRHVEPQALVNRAFAAWEAARSQGGNCVIVHDPLQVHPQQKEDERHQIELLHYALEHDRFRLLYQPIVGLQGKKEENYEVLLRVPGPDEREIEPRKLVRGDAHSTLMIEVDRWLLGRGLRLLGEQRLQRSGLKFFFPLSTASIADESMLLWILEQLRETRTHPTWVVFEAAEEAVRADIQAARRFAAALKKINGHLALEGFGTDPQSASLLKHLPLALVKIDASLSRNLGSSPERQKVIEGINGLAHSLRIQTIVSGIEDAQSLAALWSLGVDYLQGDFLQEPSPRLEFDFSAY